MLRRTLQTTAFVLLVPVSALAFPVSAPDLRVLTILFSLLVMSDTGDTENEPPVVPAPPLAALDGTSLLRATGVAVRDALPMTLTFDADRTVFVLADAEGHYFTGHLVRKGARGNRFALYFHPDSRDAFVSAVAARATSAAGRPGTRVLGKSLRLELREDEGALALKIKANVLTVSLGEVVFKAALSGVAQP
jgi:hypothetical protein